jgi:hypothetical protein
VKRLACRLFGHRYRQEHMDCARCGLTDEERRRGPLPRFNTWRELREFEQQAWNAGAEFGMLAAKVTQQQRTERAYRLGQQRMARHLTRFISRHMMERAEARSSLMIPPL